MNRGRKVINLVYDGHCAFCIRSLKVVAALDLRGALVFHDAHDPATFDRFPEMRGADVSEAMYAVVDGESPHRGFYAFRRLLWASPLMWPLLPVFYFPGMSFVGTRVYAWIARNRTRLGCRSDFCSLPSKPRAKRIPNEGQSARL